MPLAVHGYGRAWSAICKHRDSRSLQLLGHSAKAYIKYQLTMRTKTSLEGPRNFSGYYRKYSLTNSVVRPEFPCPFSVKIPTLASWRPRTVLRSGWSWGSTSYAVVECEAGGNDVCARCTCQSLSRRPRGTSLCQAWTLKSEPRRTPISSPWVPSECSGKARHVRTYGLT